MKVIQPNSPELRELKAKAIAEMDKPLLAKIRAADGEEFVFCETFFECLQAASQVTPLKSPVIVSTEVENVILKAMRGDE